MNDLHIHTNIQPRSQACVLAVVTTMELLTVMTISVKTLECLEAPGLPNLGRSKVGRW